MKNEQMFINKSLPHTIHIDLNSCFAIIEQQANRLLRGKPVGVAAYDTPRGFVLAASYEAKAKGIKLGVNVSQARAMCPGIVVMTPDPSKYREAHRRFKTLLLAYTPDVAPKSIDEFVLDMRSSPALRKRISAGTQHNEAMLEIGTEIKQKIRESLGEHVTVNIGISTNRFLAKYAAGFDKPDGMTLIDHANIHEKYRDMHLVDLPGINTRFRARLRACRIYSPLDFLNADMNTLKKQVFKGINGYYWYLRLRGHEIDNVKFRRKTIGHQYALSDKTKDIEKLQRILIKLCEKVGRRMRKNNFFATGIHLYLGFASEYQIDEPSSFEHQYKMKSWHNGEKVEHRLYSTMDIYEAAKNLLWRAEITGNVRLMSVHVYGLQAWDPEQLNLFQVAPPKTEGGKLRVITADTDVRSVDSGKRLSDAVDAINNRYGEFVITPGIMTDMQGTIIDRVAFGNSPDATEEL